MAISQQQRLGCHNAGKCDSRLLAHETPSRWDLLVSICFQSHCQVSTVQYKGFQAALTAAAGPISKPDAIDTIITNDNY